MYIRIT